MSYTNLLFFKRESPYLPIHCWEDTIFIPFKMLIITRFKIKFLVAKIIKCYNIIITNKIAVWIIRLIRYIHYTYSKNLWFSFEKNNFIYHPWRTLLKYFNFMKNLKHYQREKSGWACLVIVESANILWLYYKIYI